MIVEGKCGFPEGPGFSPDGGKLWVRNGIIYWHDGDVWDRDTPPIIRYMRSSGEDYSAWSDEKRAAVREEWRLKREKYKADAEEYGRQWAAIRASAEAKIANCGLTEDERQALRDTDLD